jgi:alginate O-acetyltransferase complex protein AlgI
LTIIFSVYFIPLLLLSSALYWLIPLRYRKLFVLAASAAVLLLIQPRFTIFLALLVLTVYWCAVSIEKKQRVGLVTAAVATLVAALVVFRYLPEFFLALHLNTSEFARTYLVPLGISYLVFKLIAFVLDVYRGEIRKPALLDLMVFVFFVPIFPAGPIQRFQEFVGQRSASICATDVIAGLARISVGYFKKIVLVGVILQPIAYGPLLGDIASGDGLAAMDTLVLIGFLIAALVYAYLDLSAYADIAIGASRLFGYRIMENMNYPLLRPNLAEYWRCWHISLSNWCRNNVYMPVLGRTRKPTLALYSSFIVMGMWHQIGLTWLFWGMWHASGIWLYGKWHRLAVSGWLNRRLPDPLAYVLGTAITVTYSALGFSFIMLSDLKQSLRLLWHILT